MKKISMVVPCYNEEGNVKLLSGIYLLVVLIQKLFIGIGIIGE